MGYQTCLFNQIMSVRPLNMHAVTGKIVSKKLFGLWNNYSECRNVPFSAPIFLCLSDSCHVGKKLRFLFPGFSSFVCVALPFIYCLVLPSGNSFRIVRPHSAAYLSSSVTINFMYSQDVLSEIVLFLPFCSN